MLKKCEIHVVYIQIVLFILKGNILQAIFRPIVKEPAKLDSSWCISKVSAPSVEKSLLAKLTPNFHQSLVGNLHSLFFRDIRIC